MIHHSEMKSREPVYVYVGNDGETVYVATARLFQWTETHKDELESQIRLFPVQDSLVRKFIRDNLIDAKRVQEIANRPPNSLTPIILCCDGTELDDRPNVLLVDGRHRYTAAWLQHHPCIRGYLLRSDQWRPFQIEGYPNVSQDAVRRMPINPRSY